MQTDKNGHALNPDLISGATINVAEFSVAVKNARNGRTEDGEDSKEKYDNYGIKKVSSIGKDWWEQVAYFENWVLANGIDAVSFDEKGHAANVDVISGATIGIDDLTRAVLDAMK